jgi:hypothetical protein
MSSKLAIALKTVLEERGLAGNLGGAAKSIGVAYPSLKKVLDGAAKPNKATAGKYQAFLGISDEDFANLLGGKAARAAKAPGARRGRKPAAETQEVPPGAGDDVQADDAEKNVTRAISPTTEPTYARRSLAGDVALDRALAALDGVLKDDLALRVHAAPAGIRALIGRILG